MSGVESSQGSVRRWAKVVAGVLLMDAGIHLYWATGQTWPVADKARLSQLVLNTQVPIQPQGLVPLAAILCCGATLVLARGGLLPSLARRLPAALPCWGCLAVAGELALRGAAGLVWVTGVGADPGDPFYWLNLLLYTPLCVLLAHGASQVATAGRRPRARFAFLRGRRD